MKRFIVNTIYFGIMPLLALILIYVITDPFKTLRPFNIYDVSVNRDYLSTELFLRNNPQYHYDSFIFGSSRGCGLNTYLWKSYLPAGSRQFLFQAWAENISGIEQKIVYLDNHKQNIRNAIVIIDIPGSFAPDQELKDAITIKHYRFSGRSKLSFQYYLFKGYLKPSEIYKSVYDMMKSIPLDIEFDTISNDWSKYNKSNWKIVPAPNKELDKKKFKARPLVEEYSKKVIDLRFKYILLNISGIFKRQHTQYRVVISPAYDQLHIHPEDLQTLETIFGKENVFNFSGKNKWTENKYNFMDLNHFDLNLGYDIINTCYKKR